jgi:ABC-type glycerol-3-phosphate transport system substrate-binding protein
MPATEPAQGAPFVPTVTPGPAVSQGLILWVSEEFSPDGDSPAARRFAARLASFQALHPGLELEVRTKAKSGLAGLAESLLAAGAAAPAALPDLALLDPAALEGAATKGLLAPLDGRLVPPAAPEWTEAASQAARINGVFYGLPFALEADGLAYRKDAYTTPPSSWADLLRGPAPFLFPAADPAALFSLAQYEALGGRLIDSARHPALDPFPLAQVLAFEDALHAAGRLPLAASQLTTTTETWAAVRDARAVSGLAAFRAFAREGETGELGLVPLPTRDGPGTVYAHAWSWALLARATGTQALAFELLEWLTDPEFLGPFTRESGVLPPTQAALALWPQDPIKESAAELLRAAHVAPSMTLQEVLGPRVSEAALAVLTGAAEADAAAQAAAAAIPPAP